ncbi:MAG: HD domain-containing protein [Geobacter sp.]|jgi:HD-GYP domain-containing protein (c-di-GMP phosphodiesterase class II)|nr:HD domain-containing protein [Geobacter sp.]
MAKKYDIAGTWEPQFVNDLVQVLISVLESRDSYTQGHIKRVAEISLAIGSRLKLSQIELRDLYAAAILYDIAKGVGTDKQTLNKQLPLDQREATIIREHPYKAGLLVVGVDSLSHLMPSILYHHEQWDGNGYPARLREESIPLYARIISVADAFDAMTSARSFRPGMSREEAVAELIQQKERQFDPDIVDILIDCLEENRHEWKDFSFYF